jgi:plasmid stability protein
MMDRMEAPKRATVYFDADVHQALRLKAAASDRSISDMVNEAVKAALGEDAEDLAAFDERKAERSVTFESFVRALKRRGRI